jgi:excisionase family DNA binding protein
VPAPQASLTVRQAAARAGVTREELLALVDSGALRAHVARGRLVIDEVDLVETLGTRR